MIRYTVLQPLKIKIISLSDVVLSFWNNAVNNMTQ
jgi:hypothetical protein